MELHSAQGHVFDPSSHEAFDTSHRCKEDGQSVGCLLKALCQKEPTALLLARCEYSSEGHDVRLVTISPGMG